MNEEGREISEILKVIGNPINLEIILLLSSAPSYPREIARLTNRSESDISKRLKKLESLGIVESRWVRLKGKTLRVYSLKIKDIRIDFQKGEMTIGSFRIVKRPSGICSDPPNFEEELVDREELVSEIKDGDWSLLYVWGPAGIGKTMLVAKALEDEPVFWHDVKSSSDVSTLYQRLQCYLSTTRSDKPGGFQMPDDVGRDIDYLVKQLSSLDIVLVFDNYHRSSEDFRKIVRKLLLEDSNARIILISREPPPSYILLAGARVLRVEGLDKDAVCEIAGVEDSLCDEVYSKTRGHPVFAKLYVIARDSIEIDYWDEAYEFIIENVVKELDPRLLEVFKLIAASPEPLSGEFLRRLLGRSVSSRLQRLRRLGLVFRVNGSYTTFDFFKSIVSRSTDYVNALDRILDELVKRGEITILSAVVYYVRAGRYEKAAEIVARKLVEGIDNYVANNKEYLDAVDSIIDNIDDVRLLAYLYLEKAIISKMKREGDILEYINKGLEFGRLSRDDWIIVRAMLMESFEFIDKGRYVEADEILRDLEELVEALGDNDLLFRYYANLAKLKTLQGEYSDALEYVVKEENYAIKTGEVSHVITAYLGHASIFEAMGDYRRARIMLDRARALSSSLGLWYQEIYVALKTAQLMYKQGTLEESLRVIEEAEELIEDHNVLIVRPWAWALKGLIYSSMGLFEEATRYCDMALAVDTSHSLGRLIALISCSIIAIQRGDVEKAKTYASMGCEASSKRYSFLLDGYSLYLRDEDKTVLLQACNNKSRGSQSR